MSNCYQVNLLQNLFQPEDSYPFIVTRLTLYKFTLNESVQIALFDSGSRLTQVETKSTWKQFDLQYKRIIEFSFYFRKKK